jgi:hypothetical protein
LREEESQRSAGKSFAIRAEAAGDDAVGVLALKFGQKVAVERGFFGSCGFRSHGLLVGSDDALGAAPFSLLRA